MNIHNVAFTAVLYCLYKLLHSPEIDFDAYFSYCLLCFIHHKKLIPET